MTGVFCSGWGWRGAMTEVMMSPVSGSRQVPAKPLYPALSLVELYTSPLYTVELLYSLCTDGFCGAGVCAEAEAVAPALRGALSVLSALPASGDPMAWTGTPGQRQSASQRSRTI